ncbi:MAG: S1 RNA-binding domain-containing protein [bacterium]
MSESKNLMDEVVNAIPKLAAGKIVRGKVLDVSNPDGVLVDIGGKAEGVIPLSEISEVSDISVGQDIDVYIIDMSGTGGSPTLSCRKAQKNKAIYDIEQAFEKGETVTARIIEQINGGVKAKINGIEAFMPNSQIGYPPVRKIKETIGQDVPVKIKKFNKIKNDIVVSWRDVVEPEYKRMQEKFWSEVREGEIKKGVVKGITKFGAFVDIGGFEGLLHIKDISWGRTERVSDELQIGQEIEVKITKLNKTENRVSLSLRETKSHPWEKVEKKYPVGSIHNGVVRGVVEYGAFVELEPGLEGLLHISELSWKRNLKTSEVLKEGQNIEVMVLKSDHETKRISLSLKNTQENPWQSFIAKHSVGETIEGRVTHLTKNGAVVELPDAAEGFILLKDFSWKERISHPSDMLSVDQQVSAKILSISVEEQKIYLGLKQIEDSPFKNYVSGRSVTGTVAKVDTDKLIMDLPDGIPGFIHISQIESGKTENLSAFSEGQKIEAVVIKVNENLRMIELSIKELEKQKENETMQQYYSSESAGFSIGDILKKE